MTLGQTAGALLLPMLARHEDRRRLLLLALALQLVGFCGLIFCPQTLPAAWAIICGLGLGGAFPLCTVLALDHAAHPAVGGRLAAFMQEPGLLLPGCRRGCRGFCAAQAVIICWTGASTPPAWRA